VLKRRCKRLAKEDYYDILGVPRGATDEEIKKSLPQAG